MNSVKRIFVIGHPGAGKALFSKELAKKLDWKFVNADFELEIRLGKPLGEILGNDGSYHYHLNESKMIKSLKNVDNIVVTTDASILDTKENQELLASEFIIYLNVKTETQISRTARNELPFLISSSDDFLNFLNKLHQDRDAVYERICSYSISTDDSKLENHIEKTLKIILLKIDFSTVNKSSGDNLIIFHKILHTPVHLNQKQSNCLELLASGKSSKEIATIMNISNRTVDDHIEKLMGILGCSSSKELIALFHDQP